MKTLSVLLVDDSPEFLAAATHLLATLPHLAVVGSARSGVEALERVRALQPDLVLMDVAMPGMDGLEATRRVKDSATAPRVLLVSLHEAREYREAPGADGFVSKADFAADIARSIHALFPQALST